MPNVSRKRLLQSIRKEKDPVARERLLACRYRKKGYSIRRICKIMVRPYSTMPCETGYGACRRAVSAAGTTRNGADEGARYPRRYSGLSGAG